MNRKAVSLILAVFLISPSFSQIHSSFVCLAPRHVTFVAGPEGIPQPAGAQISRRRAIPVIGAGTVWGVRLLQSAAIVLAGALVQACNKKDRDPLPPPANPAPPQPPPPTPAPATEIHADWLVGQINPNTGFIKSYENPSDTFCHTYNQAQGAMAFLIAHAKSPSKGYDLAARNVLIALTSRQNPDGSFPAAYDFATGNPTILAKQTGGNAFVGLAINLYTRETGDQQFVAAGERLADYLASLALSRAAFPGRALPNESAIALSAEENLAGYGFLIEFADLVGNSGKATIYRALADDIRRFLESLWNNNQGRFNQGRNSGGAVNGAFQILDQIYAADVQTGGRLALGRNGQFNNFNFDRAIDPTRANSVKQILEVQTPAPTGIAFDNTTAILALGMDGAQTARYGLALKEAGGFAAEAQTQIANALQLSNTADGVNPFTGVFGKKGGVFTLVRDRGSITVALGPSVEATAETIFALAGVNIYRASVGSAQFFTLDSRLRKILKTLLHEAGRDTPVAFRRQHEYNRALSISLEKHSIDKGFDDFSLRLGKIDDEGIAVLEDEFIQWVEFWLLRLPAALKKIWYDEEEQLTSLVRHHEEFIHRGIQRVFSSIDPDDLAAKKGAFNNEVSALSAVLTDGFLTHVDSGDDFTEEFLAWLIAAHTYPQAARLQFHYPDGEVLLKARAIAEKHFPGLIPLFQTKVEGNSPSERKLFIDRLLSGLTGHAMFETAL